MIRVLVTGKDSQLVRCIQDLETNYPSILFDYKNSKDLDITNFNLVENYFQNSAYDYCLNCAAYTNVDKAESEPELAKRVNTDAVENLAINCDKLNVVLIHISTDFVFDGESKIPYSETDRKNPLGVYGKTKSDGENKIIDILDSYFIIRTSWLYSQYNTNFLKTMLSLSKIKEEISVVNDQIGCPTNANDLADLICNIISSNSKTFDIYHFCNKGEVNWFGFAEEIFKKWNLEVGVKPIKTIEYPTPAKRPSYSVLDTSKTEKTFHFNINNWKDALGNLKLIQNKE